MTYQATVEPEFDLRSYMDVVRRRYLYFLVPVIIGIIATVAVARLWPAGYRAAATILVESQQIPSDLARSTVTSDASERISIIRQRLMTRSNLLDIVREFNLYADERERLSSSEIVDTMRAAAKIEQIDVGTGSRRRDDKQVIAFTISFDYVDPNVAARIANRFVELVLQQNIQSRTRRASETYQFFQDQVQSLERQIVAQEAAIVVFKTENEAALPESLAYRRALLTDLQSRIPQLDQRIQTLQAEKVLLAESGAIEQAGDPDGTDLAALRQRLAQLLAIYSERHPEVVRVRERITALEGALASPPEDAAEDRDVEPDPAPALSADATARMKAIDVQIAAFETQRTQELERIAELEATLQQTPQVEIALNALNRDFAALEEQLQRARASMEEASIGEQLEEERQAERFEIIEQATAPTEPATPNRPRILLAGLFASIGAGVGLVILLELLDKSIRTGADLERRLQMRPLSAIPLVQTSADLRSRRKTRWVIVIAIIACGVALLVAIHLVYLPLDLVADKLLQKLPM